MTNPTHFQKWLESQGRSLQWLAEATGMAIAYLSRLSNLRSNPPTYQTLQNLAAPLGVSVSELAAVFERAFAEKAQHGDAICRCSDLGAAPPPEPVAKGYPAC